MARTIRDTSLESRAARSRLESRKKPYYRAIEEGLHLGYRKARGRKGKPAGAGKWLVRHYLGGQSYRLKNIGAADDFSDADGVAILSFSQAQAIAREHMVFRAHAAAGKAPFTVRQCLDNYVNWAETNRKSAQWARGHADNNICPHLGHLLVTDLTSEILEKWHRDRAKAPALRRPNQKGERKLAVATSEDAIRKRKVTANRCLTVFKAALNRAWHAKKILSDDAWRRVEPFHDVEEPRVRWLEMPEANRLIHRAEPAFSKLVEGALDTGARFGELAKLNVEDFQSATGTLHIRRSKVGKARHIELTDEGIEFFTNLCAGRSAGDPMFMRADGQRWKTTQQVRPMKEACNRAKIGIDGQFFNVLRHTWASQAVMNGVPLMVVAKNMGHSTTRMVEKHYGHMAPSFVRDEIRKGAPRFRSIGSNVRSLDIAREMHCRKSQAGKQQSVIRKSDGRKNADRD